MKIYGIIMAAGEGRRANGNKLSRCLCGVPMLEQVICIASASHLDGLLVVTGKEKEFVETLAARFEVNTIHNSNYTDGMTSSLQKGVSTLPADADGFMVLLGDMPYLKPSTIDFLLQKFEKDKIIIPTYGGKGGHPPVYGIRFKKDILSITGNIGAKEVLQNNQDCIRRVDVDDAGILKDVDFFAKRVHGDGILTEYY